MNPLIDLNQEQQQLRSLKDSELFPVSNNLEEAKVQEWLNPSKRYHIANANN